MPYALCLTFYAMELAQLVREGIMARTEALERVSEPIDFKDIKQVEGRLGLLHD